MLFGPGEHGVLRRDVDDVAAEPLLDERLRGGLRHEERALGHHVVLQVPVLLGGLQQRLRERQPGVVDDEVDAAEREQRRVDRGLHAIGVGDVRGDADGDIRPTEFGCGRLRLREVEVGDNDARALSGEAGRDRLADPGCRSRDERDAALVGLGLGHPLQLGLFERPVLDAELLGIRDGGVGRDPLGAAHDVDRVEVELSCDARGLLVGAVAEHADARHQHDERVGAADRGGLSAVACFS